MANSNNWIDIASDVQYSPDLFSIPPHYIKDIKSVLIPNGFVKDRIARLAFDIVNDTDGPLNICCILKGGYQFFSDLVANIKKIRKVNNQSIPLTYDFIRVKSYVNTESTGNIQVSLTENELKKYEGKDILIVEDLVDTGKTMVELLKLLKKYNPKSIKVACLMIKKRENKDYPYIPDYVGFSIPDEFIVGYALDYNEHYRDLDHVCIINDEAKKRFSI
ncbi:hypoxanthine-guanine phosphoribosyltransferase-like protein [Anaeromyces robustus]|uniref:Hypoxanthine phosphoribosyltransferase n=1 Tax=Anaeromyces robustus TaxID=1754192 RepID=A0A1Y1XR92_9FUNG|nr:hypoxanthine-guanine phosphoribosyltransferase-like protein [Anaeromyces robustus]|eukprot:ORX88281.1 hypoxanthine-guanine phosphoribosyltransferase-like protein [Anaeromyces robustus]